MDKQREDFLEMSFQQMYVLCISGADFSEITTADLFNFVSYCWIQVNQLQPLAAFWNTVEAKYVNSFPAQMLLVNTG